MMASIKTGSNAKVVKTEYMNFLLMKGQQVLAFHSLLIYKTCTVFLLHRRTVLNVKKLVLAFD